MSCQRLVVQTRLARRWQPAAPILRIRICTCAHLSISFKPMLGSIAAQLLSSSQRPPGSVEWQDNTYEVITASPRHWPSQSAWLPDLEPMQTCGSVLLALAKVDGIDSTPRPVVASRGSRVMSACAPIPTRRCRGPLDSLTGL